MATFIGGENKDVLHLYLESSGSISGSWVEIKRVCRFDAGWTIKSSESPSTRGMGLPGHSTTGLEAGAKTKMTHNRRPNSPFSLQLGSKREAQTHETHQKQT